MPPSGYESGQKGTVVDPTTPLQGVGALGKDAVLGALWKDAVRDLTVTARSGSITRDAC